MPDATGALRIALIGAGKMGQAILSGWLACETGAAATLTPASFFVVNPSAEKRERLERELGVSCIEDVSQLEPCDVVILAVKPQIFGDVLPKLAAFDWVACSLVVSIAAGITTATIEAALPQGTHVIRAMPNTALSVGAGACALCAGVHATDEDVSYMLDLFSSLGLSVVVDEAHMDAVGAISGSGPAYVAALVEALRDAGVQAGLDAEVAERLGAQTVLGTGYIMAQGQSAEQTRIDVCSPQGSTLAALAAMEQAGYSESIKRGVEAAIMRSEELGAQG